MMHFETLAEALFMEGHGLYVWSAYAITLIPAIAMIVLPLRRLKRYRDWIDSDMAECSTSSVTGLSTNRRDL